MPSGQMDRYNIIPIALGIAILYLGSWFAQKKCYISADAHRKIWNVLLLLSFLALAFLSLVLVYVWSLGVMNPLPIDVTFWHVESGIVLVFIALFHIIWHAGYFLGLARKPKPPPSRKK